MRRTIFLFALWLAAPHMARPAMSSPVRASMALPAAQSRVVDRIVARIEDDIILESQVRELAAFQKLVEGQAESDDQLLSELIEQWMVQTEASASHFPEPAKSEVDRELARLAERFASPEAYSARLRDLGLSAGQVRDMIDRQIYVERYLDYKFRPSVQIDPPAIDAYYKSDLIPELQKKKQAVPPEDDVREQIRELLVQKQISELTAKWLDETRSRLKIERVPAEAGQ
ncbi:MAG: hypothetical protein ACRD4Y_13670 [Candidatus Acidiferrales bacterium]